MTLGNPGTRKWLPIFAAFIGSFTVYLTPALAVHTGLMPVGIFLLGAFYGLTSGEFVRSVSSILFVLLFQILLGLAIFWTLRGFRWWKSVALVLLLPVLAFALNAGLFIGLPALFLLERDPAPEFGELAEVCQVADAFVLHVTAGVEGVEGKHVVVDSGSSRGSWAEVPRIPHSHDPLGRTVDGRRSGQNRGVRGDVFGKAPGGARNVVDDPVDEAVWHGYVGVGQHQCEGLGTFGSPTPA